MTSKLYDSDLTDAEYALLRPFLPAPTLGRPAPDPQCDLLRPARRRAVADATGRLPVLEDGVPLLPAVAPERVVGSGTGGSGRRCASWPARSPVRTRPAEHLRG